MKKDPLVLVNHMLESISLIRGYTRNMTITEFKTRKETQDAVIRRLEIIGEAANKVSPEFREKHQDIPWRNISGLRNILIHEYFGVDLNLTWNVIKDDLPVLEKNLRKIKQD